MDRDITINVQYEGREYELTTYVGEYRNLMMLIFDRIYIEEFGECRGMGRCGTCLIVIVSSHSDICALDRNEKATLHKTGIAAPGIRLACQILIDHSLNNSRIQIWEGQK